MSSPVGLMSFSRTWVIACHTFTQLSRMKVFYFLIVFAILVIGINFFELPTLSVGASGAEEHLKLVKNMSFGAMEIFSLLFGVSATALLIPKDLEDRTLYTILSKPVPRIDYLFGKLLGVLLIVAVAIVVMDLLLCAVVYARAYGIEMFGMEGLIPSEMLAYEKSMRRDGLTGQALEMVMQRKEIELEGLGLTQRMQIGILAIYLKTVVISAMALLLSTFSSSTLFTIIVTFVVWVIGMFQHEAKEAYIQTMSFGDGWYMKAGSGLVAVLFPDLHVYNVTDSVTQANAKPIPLKDIGKMLLISPAYTAIYSILAWFVFRKKEF